MSSTALFIVAFIAGVAASLGLGGGVILILYMIFFTQIPQLTAQGINLIFFIPIAILSIILHRKNGLVKLKGILPAIMCGCIFSAISSLIATQIPTNLLSKLFGIFILTIGIKELVKKNK